MMDLQHCKVSIIIPVYNVEKYLIKCLDSAINQSHLEKEIIIIDDGSTDGTAEIISNYQKQHNQILTIQTENRGQSAARNTGLEIASGNYIIFLDGDDWIEKDTIELCLKAIQEYDTDLVMFNASAFADGMSEGEVRKFDYTRSSSVTNTKFGTRELFSSFISNVDYLVSPCLYMYKFDTFRELRFQPGIIYEDNLFTTRLLIDKNDATAICLPNRFFHRRLRPGSTMTEQKTRKHVDSLFSVAIGLLAHEVVREKSSTSRALNHFIQSTLSNAVITSREVFGKRLVLRSRAKALRLLLKSNLRYAKIRTILVSIFPELNRLSRRSKRATKKS